MFATRARDNACFVAFCNTVGGQDELIFDGHSLVIDDEGDVLARAPGFEEALLRRRRRPDGRRRAPADATCAGARSRRTAASSARSRRSSRRRAARADGHGRRRRSRRSATSSSRCGSRSSSGSRDYVRKNGFSEVVVGVSGGIDSALDGRARGRGARRRARALRLDAVALLVRGDARRRAAARREPRLRLPRDRRSSRSVETFDASARAERSRAASPISPRRTCRRAIRGMLLMALSNKFGWLLVATGNKSELSVGYATLYGDMAGGFALLKDVFKTDVFRLARHLNERAGPRADPAVDHRARAERRAARRPARRGLAAAVSAARPGARGLRRGRPLARGALAGRLRPGRRRARASR